MKKAKRRKMQKRGYCWNKKHYVMKPSGGWWTGRGALSKKPPVLATIIENWQHKALLGQGVTTALGILRFQIKGLLKQWLASGVLSCYDTRPPGVGGEGRGRVY